MVAEALAQPMRRLGVEEHQVGVVALFDPPLACDAPDACGPVAEPADDLVEGEAVCQRAVGEEAKQVGHGRHAGGRSGIGGRLLFGCVRRMIGGPHLQGAGLQPGPDRAGIVGRLHRRVHLHERAEPGVVVGGEQEVVGAGLGREQVARVVCGGRGVAGEGERAAEGDGLEFAEVLARGRVGQRLCHLAAHKRAGEEEAGQQHGLCGCRDVEEVEAVAAAERELERAPGGADCRLHIANPRVVRDAGDADERVAVGEDGGLVFAVGADGCGGLREDALERSLIVDEQVAGAGADEDLDAGAPAEGGEIGQVARRAGGVGGGA